MKILIAGANGLIGCRLYAAEGRTPRVYPWMNELFNEALGSEATFGSLISRRLCASERSEKNKNWWIVA